MKIAIVRKKYIFHGGSESFSDFMIRKLSELGHEIHIFTIKWELSERLNNVFVHRVPAFTINSFFRDLTFIISSFFLLKHQRKNIDIIQSHDKTLYQDIYRAGDGCHIEWLQQRWKRTGFAGKLAILLNPYHWLVLKLERKIFHEHRYKKIIAISKLVKKDILTHYHIPESDIEVIYNGVDLKRFHPSNKELYREEIRRKHGIQDSEFVILFVGSGFKRKGLRFLLNAVNLIQQRVTVLIAGKGSEKRYNFKEKKQNIIFCGPQRDIHKYYAASDIFVFPTIYEPFGNVHLEALASGLPVITTNQSGAAEIIENGVHGFIIPAPEDYAAIAERIKFLLENPDHRKTISYNARKRAEEFSIDRFIKNILNLYENLAGKK